MFEYKEWYEQNAALVNNKRREKYASNAAYRIAQVERNKSRRTSLAEVRKKERIEQMGAQKMPKPAEDIQPIEVSVTVGDKVVRQLMFTTGALTQALGVSLRALYKWEREGLLPATPIKDARGHKLYTAEQVEWIRKRLIDRRKIEEVAVPRRRSGSNGVVKIVELGDGKKAKQTFFKLSSLAALLDHKSESVKQWETEGYLPATPFLASSMQHRLYTAEMVEAVRLAYVTEGGTLRQDEAKKRFHTAVMSAWSALGVFQMSLYQPPPPVM